MVVQVARARPPPLAGVEPEVTVPVGPGPGAHWHPSHGMPWAARLGPGGSLVFFFVLLIILKVVYL